MAFFLISPTERGELVSAYARATGVPTTAAVMLGRAAHDEAEGMPASAELLRDLAAERTAA